MKISVIVPLYHGKKYINQIIKQLEDCVKQLTYPISVELIFQNDLPEDKIEDSYYSKFVDVLIFNTSINRGIHGARVQGLNNCSGDYILFLDQDDEIFPLYIESQYSKIGDADAIVCRVNNGGKYHYTNTFVFEEVVTKEFMLNNWCSIISPGQVLIRKNAIPLLWKENVLQNNGADDYFLWLAMMAEDAEIVLNQDVLFFHTLNGVNTSNNTNMMMDSEIEMISILKENKVFDGDDKKLLEKLPDSLRRIHVKQLDIQNKCLFLMQNLIKRLKQGENVFKELSHKNIKKIAIYGAGIIGRNIKELLCFCGIDVFCFIDQNAEFIDTDIWVYTKFNAPEDIDFIILTIEDDELKRELEEICKCKVKYIKDI